MIMKKTIGGERVGGGHNGSLSLGVELLPLNETEVFALANLLPLVRLSQRVDHTLVGGGRR